LGRTVSEQRTIAVEQTMSYDYNLDSSVKAVHYPSGSAVTYIEDSVGRMLSAIDTANGVNYVTSATYGPDSAIAVLRTVTQAALSELPTASITTRLQPLNMSASTPSQTVFSMGTISTSETVPVAAQQQRQRLGHHQLQRQQP